MIIEGVEYLPNNIMKEVIEFILNNFLDNEKVVISEVDDNLYLINDKKYFIVRSYDTHLMIDEFNEDLLKDALAKDTSNYNYWINYINIEGWADENGINDMEDYLAITQQEEFKYKDVVGRVEFYECM